MKPGLFSLPSTLAMMLLAMPLVAWADHNPDFDDDAKPILRMQPNLLQFVEATYQVRDTGLAKIPGDDDRHAEPPYIFKARPRGYPGDYYITLLIQPGPPGHVLKIIDPTQPGGVPPFVPHKTASESQKPTSQSAPPPTAAHSTVAQASAAQTPVPAQSSKQPAAPTADTPSGPISSNSASLEPPPDPPPVTH